MQDDYLVSTQWLSEHLDDPQVRVLDVSGNLDAERNNLAHDDYVVEHVPGAVWFDVASGYGELSDPSSPLWWTWPSMRQIEGAMGRSGVDNRTTVVIVARSADRPYGHGSMWCTRAWWTLHHSEVRCVILAGGHERWKREGRPLESGDVTVPPRTFIGTDRRHEGIADRDDVQTALETGASCVVDALPTDVFRGERTPYARPGHITGAQNVPFHSLIAEPTADFVPVERASAIFDEAGLFDRNRVIVYCGGAISATVTAFALKRSGHPDVRVYDGSLQEWAAEPTLPMST